MRADDGSVGVTVVRCGAGWMAPIDDAVADGEHIEGGAGGACGGATALKAPVLLSLGCAVWCVFLVTGRRVEI